MFYPLLYISYNNLTQSHPPGGAAHVRPSRPRQANPALTVVAQHDLPDVSAVCDRRSGKDVSGKGTGHRHPRDAQLASQPVSRAGGAR